MTSLEQHLAAHEYTFGACGCGHAFEYDSRTLLSAIRDAHRAHVAATWREARTVRTVEDFTPLSNRTRVAFIDSDNEPFETVEVTASGLPEGFDAVGLSFWLDGMTALIVWTPEDGAL